MMPLSILNSDETPGLAQLAEEDDGDWAEMEVTVDSCACDMVMPLSVCDFAILPFYQSKHKMAYEAASGA